jgi:hypothetical protein
MSWTNDYQPGDEIKAYHQGNWKRGAVVSRRKNSLMVFLGKFGHINVHDSRNIQSWQSEKEKPQSTSQEPPLLDF